MKSKTMRAPGSKDSDMERDSRGIDEIMG